MRQFVMLFYGLLPLTAVQKEYIPYIINVRPGTLYVFHEVRRVADHTSFRLCFFNGNTLL